MTTPPPCCRYKSGNEKAFGPNAKVITARLCDQDDPARRLVAGTRATTRRPSGRSTPRFSRRKIFQSELDNLCAVGRRRHCRREPALSTLQHAHAPPASSLHTSHLPPSYAPLTTSACSQFRAGTARGFAWKIHTRIFGGFTHDFFTSFETV